MPEPDAICGFCGCAWSRCQQALERFGTERCCTHCDHEDDR